MSAIQLEETGEAPAGLIEQPQASGVWLGPRIIAGTLSLAGE